MRIKRILDYFLLVLLSFCVFLLVFIPIDINLSQSSMWFNKFRIVLSTWLFLLIVFSLNFFDWVKVFSKIKFLIPILFLTFVSVGFLYKDYREERLIFESLPRIYQVSPKNGVQGRIIKIEGINLGHEYQSGKVFLGNDEMFIKFWSENMVIVEQSVPSKFGITNLYLVRNDGLVSNNLLFQIIDPNLLQNFYE